MKMKPNSVKKDIITASPAALKRMFWSSRTSGIGSATRRSHRMKTAGWSALPAIDPGDAQSCQGRAVWPGVIGLRKELHGHCDDAQGNRSEREEDDRLQVVRSRKRPTTGPSTIAAPAVAPHTPIDKACSSRLVKVFVSNKSVAGNVMAAPGPITARAEISSAGVIAKPPMRLAAPKTRL